MKKILFALTIACALAVSAVAQAKQHDHGGKPAAAAGQAKTEFLAKGDGVETCPVTGEAISSKDVKADFFGRTVYFCCPGCMEEAKKNPAAYVKKTQAEQLAALKDAKPAQEAGHDHHAEHADHAATQDKAKDNAKDGETKFLGKGDGIETCPVTGEPVNKNLKGEVNGRTFYVCCEGCIETVKKDPDAYLKKQDKK